MGGQRCTLLLEYDVPSGLLSAMASRNSSSLFDLLQNEQALIRKTQFKICFHSKNSFKNASSLSDASFSEDASDRLKVAAKYRRACVISCMNLNEQLTLDVRWSQRRR